MIHDVKVPSAGESITQIFIGQWQKKEGEIVKQGDLLVDLETEKTSFDLHAEYQGRLEILIAEPETQVKPGDVIAKIDDSVPFEVETTKEKVKNKEETTGLKEKLSENEKVVKASGGQDEPLLGPAARKRAQEEKSDLQKIKGSGREGRILKEDILEATPKKNGFKDQSDQEIKGLQETKTPHVQENKPGKEDRIESREKASRIRQTIAANLVKAQSEKAAVTTFNQVDMSQVVEFRRKYKQAFKEKYQISLGMVGFFALASLRALRKFPLVNAAFTGEEILKRNFVDLSVAISTEAGLVAPIIRDAHQKNLVDLEKALAELSEKAAKQKLSIEEMSGGTFTISNGGVFGSLLSTPLLHGDQSAILGLHKIEDRPIVIENKIEIRPMMYMALSYDHRLIDGREAVQFLVSVKEGIEELYHILKEEDL